MSTVTITAEKTERPQLVWRASASGKHSLGRTAGEALDALTQEMNADTSGVMVLVQPMQPDQYFTQAQQTRLAELMAQWRQARDLGTSLPAAEMDELEALVDAQLEGATKRAAALGSMSRP